MARSPDPATRPSSVLPLLAAATAVTAMAIGYTFGVYLPLFRTPHTALEGVARRPSAFAPSPGLARRLTVVMIDGMSYAGARAFEPLAPLRRAGVFRELAPAYPSYTSPALVSMVTGLTPRDTGVRFNGVLTGVAGLDSVPRAAADAGVALRFFSREWPPFDVALRAPAGAESHRGRLAYLVSTLAREAAPPELAPMDGKGPTHELTFVYLPELDLAAHEHGLLSPEVAQGRRVLGALVARTLRATELGEDTVVFLSDHGHIDPGGHGGVEPEAMSAFFLVAGGLARRGVELPRRPMVDVASTLAILAGVRVPETNLGRPMLDALSVEDEAVPLLLAAPFEEAADLLCRLEPHPRCAEVGALAARLRKLDVLAADEATALLDALQGSRDQALATRAALASSRRLAVAAAGLALVLGAVLAALAARTRRRAGAEPGAARRVGGWPLGPLDLVPPFLNLGVYAALLAALGYRVTFSTMKPGLPFLAEATPAGLAAVVAVTLFGLAARPRGAAAWVLVASTTAPWVLLAAYLGWDPTSVPPPAEGVALFQLGPAVISAAVGAVALGVLEARQRARGAPHARPAASATSASSNAA